jgi:HTH-type transcriptional regulator/antitoxin HipB
MATGTKTSTTSSGTAGSAARARPPAGAKAAGPARAGAPLQLPVFLPGQAGRILQSRRKALKLSQAEVAAQLGIRQSRYSELESHPESMRLDQMFTLVNILGIEVLFQDKLAAASKAEW